MQDQKNRINSTVRYVLAFFKWLLAAVTLGALCGLIGTGFHKTIDLVTELRTAHPWLIWLLPLAGVLTLLCYRLCRVSFSAGTNLIIETVSTNEHVPILLAPLIFIGTTLSHLFGASVGREGAALQLGGSIGHNFGELLHFDEEDVRVLSMCGMAACFSTLFGTPFTAAVFVLEVISVGSMRYNAFLPCVVASYSAALVAKALGVAPMSFSPAGGVPALTPLSALQAVGLGALAGLVGIVFCVCMHRSAHFAERFLKNPYLRIALGGLAMALVVGLFGLSDYAGAGTGVIAEAVDAGKAAPEAFVLKLLLTALCVGAGFRGGEIVPTMFVGAAFGCAVGPLLGLPAGFSAALGLIALFCSVVNCPLASAFLAVELFGTAELPLFAIAIAAAFVLSGYFGLYSSQRIVYSKVRQEVIDQKTL